LDTPHIEIGEGTKINEQVFVGGLQSPDSKLVIGRNCQIMQMTFINPAKSITIGDDTAIGGDCLIFGHYSWMNRFEGYPVDFRPVEIGNSVSIAWRVFILPGAKIGDGVMIGANSMVNRTIPPRCLAVGSPAEIVARAPYFPRNLRDKEKETILREIVSEFAGFLIGHGVRCKIAGDEIEVAWRGKGWFQTGERREKIRVVTTPLNGTTPLEAGDRTTVVVSLWKIPGELQRKMSHRGIVWFDIESKERADLSNDLGEEVCHYLRRHGVRFNRVLVPA
jgi:acetyltransferase-like isoleucine patch superfamily enzyme